MMKHLNIMGLGAVAVLMALAGCSKDIVDEQPQEVGDPCQLNIVTRGADPTDDDGTPSVKTGRIYVFDQDNNCVRILSTDEDTQGAETQLPAGIYSFYAVGGFDVERVSLPSQDDATPQSELQLLSGKVMDDLLLAHTEPMTLPAGDNRMVTINLERQVQRIDQVTIYQVPANVTGVELLIEPLYQKVCLDGTLPTATESATIVLDEGENGTWQAEPMLYLLPSKGKPVITVRFLYDGGSRSYSYSASEPMEANHKVKIEGTYRGSGLGVTLTGVLQGMAWGEDRTITFDFDETNSSQGNNDDDPGEDAPTVGSFYKGCYVVGVSGKTVTLVSPTMERFVVEEDEESKAIAKLNQKLAAWTAVEGVSGTWRLPTLAEAGVFLLDPACADISAKSYYCTNNGALWVISVKSNGAGWTTTNAQWVDTNDWLRPVIDVTLP
ncbi:MAG: FimB/Mfa2 family fimbrial subunit [Prevotella sp.]|nr:FimB/Mfa2 family fimbrial subunit [Prevotella sp.]